MECNSTDRACTTVNTIPLTLVLMRLLLPTSPLLQLEAVSNPVSFQPSGVDGVTQKQLPSPVAVKLVVLINHFGRRSGHGDKGRLLWSAIKSNIVIIPAIAPRLPIGLLLYCDAPGFVSEPSHLSLPLYLRTVPDFPP